MSRATYHDAKLSNAVNIHYVEAGIPTAQNIVLLHGFPSSSTGFKRLIPLLAESYHVLAPDLPGFGFTTVPPEYKHTFANLAVTIGLWLDKLNINSFAIYCFDYGAPTAYRLALERPNDIKAFVVQNGNAYEEGLAPSFWGPLQQWWKDGDISNQSFRSVASNAVLTMDAFKWQYVTGAKDRLSNIDPASWTMDYLHNALTDAQKEIQLDLFFSYGSNVELYPQFQEYFRKHQPPMLIAWAKGDPVFPVPGAEAYKKDLKDIDYHVLDGPHFLLETHNQEVADLITNFLRKVKV